MKKKITMCCSDAHMFNKQVETKFEMLFEEYNMEKMVLIGMPLEKLPLNCNGLPLIVQNIHDYLINYGLYEECLFDEAYSNNVCQSNITNAYELVSGSEKSCKTIIDIDAIDVATILVIWLHYLPEPLVSSKQFTMICDLHVSNKIEEILNSMDKIHRQTLQRVINIVDSYEKQHRSYKKKLGNLFALLLTKNGDINGQTNSLLFINNLKTVFLELNVENNEHIFNHKCSINFHQDECILKYNSCIKENLYCRSLSDDGLVLNTDITEVNATVKFNAMKKSSSCDLERLICKEDDHYNKSFTNGLSFCEENSKSKPDHTFSDNLSNSICEVDESVYNSHIDDMRSIERTMHTHPRSFIKRNKKKSIRSHVEMIFKSGFLSNEDNLLLQNTLELMKILSKIKNLKNQINIQKRNREAEFGFENEEVKNSPELNFLNARLEKLINQKNNYLSKTGLSYGRSYNRIVLSLKNAQKEAFKLHDDKKNNQKCLNENADKLISDIYNIQVVLDYLENNCGGKELPWRSSKGCPGLRRKTKKQLNCVTVVSDLQTIGEHEVI